MALTYGLNIGADCIVRSIGYSSNNVRTCSSSKDSSDSSKSIVVLDSWDCKSIASNACSGLSDHV